MTVHLRRPWLRAAPPAAFAGEALSWDVRDGVVEVRLHRGPCNEIGTTALDDLERLADFLVTGADGARAVLMWSSLPRGFCAGADLRELQAEIARRRTESAPARVLGAVRASLPGRAASLADRAARRLHGALLRRGVRGFLDRVHGVFDALDTLPLPVVAAVHGPVFGGGFELALTADLIVADKTARFAFPELRLGLLPGFGGIPRLERDVGNGLVRDLLLTGRTLGAVRAHEVGLVHQVVPPGQHLDAARRLVAQVLRYDAEVVADVKSFAKPLPAARLAEEKRRFVRLVADPRVQRALDDFVTRTDARPYLP